MLRYLSTNPWPLVIILALAAAGFLTALLFTQRGKYAILALVTVSLATLTIAVDRLWVTDEERIEAVVYALARGAENSDFVAVDMHLAPEVTITSGDTAIERSAVVTEVSQLLEKTQFDFIRISRLAVHVGSMSRQGSAEFRVHASCTVETPYGHFNYVTPASGLDWSLGFRETSPGVWKVSRISPPPTIWTRTRFFRR